MLGDNKYVKTFLTIGGIAGGILAIAGAYRLLFPKVASKNVEITEVHLQSVGPSGGCESQIIVSLRIKIDGYRDQPVKLYSRLDDSSASVLPADGVPCASPLGAWDSWQHAKDVKAAVESQTLQVDIPVTVYLRKQNRSIRLKATDANEQVLAMAVSPVFSSTNSQVLFEEFCYAFHDNRQWQADHR